MKKVTFIKPITLIYMILFSLQSHAGMIGREFHSMSSCIKSIKNQTNSNSMELLTDSSQRIAGITSSGHQFNCSLKSSGTKGTYVEGYYVTKNGSDKGPGLILIIIVASLAGFGLLLIIGLILDKFSVNKFDSLVKLKLDFDNSKHMIDYMKTKAIYIDESNQTALLLETKEQGEIAETLIDCRQIEKIEVFDNYKLIMTTGDDKILEKTNNTTTNYTFKISGKQLPQSEFKLMLADPKIKKGEISHDVYLTNIKSLFNTLNTFIK